MRKLEMYYDDVVGMEVCDDRGIEPGMNSPRSDNCLRFARSHAELAGRPQLDPKHGCSIKEPLQTDDNWNRD